MHYPTAQIPMRSISENIIDEPFAQKTYKADGHNIIKSLLKHALHNLWLGHHLEIAQN